MPTRSRRCGAPRRTGTRAWPAWAGLTGDSYRTRQRRELLAKDNRASDS
jgi:hypothetical protein